MYMQKAPVNRTGLCLDLWTIPRKGLMVYFAAILCIGFVLVSPVSASSVTTSQDGAALSAVSAQSSMARPAAAPKAISQLELRVVEAGLMRVIQLDRDITTMREAVVRYFRERNKVAASFAELRKARVKSGSSTYLSEKHFTPEWANPWGYSYALIKVKDAEHEALSTPESPFINEVKVRTVVPRAVAEFLAIEYNSVCEFTSDKARYRINASLPTTAWGDSLVIFEVEILQSAITEDDTDENGA